MVHGPQIFFDRIGEMDKFFNWYNMSNKFKICFTKMKLQGPIEIWAEMNAKVKE